MKYKCLICGEVVKFREASYKMKYEKVCEKCLLEYVITEKVANDE